MKEKLWLGSPIKCCNICGREIHDYFVDGDVRGRGWAILCLLCHQRVGTGTGTGKGQKYERRNKDTKDEKWVKIEG